MAAKGLHLAAGFGQLTASESRDLLRRVGRAELWTAAVAVCIRGKSEWERARTTVGRETVAEQRRDQPEQQEWSERSEG